MYLVSVYEKDAIVEASLGGRVTAEEIRVLGEELEELLEGFEEESYSMLLDFSKAKRLDTAAMLALGDVKDYCLNNGAIEIVSVPVDEFDSIQHQTLRMQQILEGRERFVSEPSHARIAARRESQAEYRIAA